MFQELWKRMVSGRKECALEAEVARQRAEIDRLRAENRALLNSILGIAGIPPIIVAGEDLSLAESSAADARHETSGHVFSRADQAAAPDASVGAGFKPAPTSPTTGDARSAAPRRLSGAKPRGRRSWHQINRMLEFESARKPVTSD